MLRLRWLVALIPVLLVACGSGGRQTLSANNAPGVDVATLASRYRVVKTSPTSTFKEGDVVDLGPAGDLSSGPGPGSAIGHWQLVGGTRLEIDMAAKPAPVLSFSVRLEGDLLRLVDPRGEETILRRALGPPPMRDVASTTLQEDQFLLLLRQRRVETATIFQTGRAVHVTGVYDGSRYSVTLQSCDVITALPAAMRQGGVLNDGLPASELRC